MRNIDKVVDYILKNAGKLAPDKIKALAEVVGQLDEREETVREPNKLPEESNDYLSETSPMDLADVQGIQIDDNKEIKTKIYK